MNRRGLAKVLPDWPARRYTVFAGTSTPRDAAGAFARVLAPGRGADDAERYARLLGSATGCGPAAIFGAGRMGLYAILEVLGLGEGHEIILPGFTCAVVPNAMVYRGVRPVYVDIDPVTFNIDLERVERAITPRTRAIYAQHTFGVACDVRAIRAIADRRGLLVIEDIAHALGAEVDGGPVGSFGDASFGSSDRTKVINTHVGGWAASRDPEVNQRLVKLAEQSPALSGSRQRLAALSLGLEIAMRAPLMLWLGRPLLGAMRRAGVEFVWRDEQSDVKPSDTPYPCRFPESLASSGVRQMEDLPRNLAHRRELARWLEGRLGWYGPAMADRFDTQAWLRYSFLVRDRDEFVRRFGSRLDLGIWFTEPVFGRPDSAARVGYQPGSCPNAEHAARHIVNFPTHQRLPLEFLKSLVERHGAWLDGQILRPR